MRFNKARKQRALFFRIFCNSYNGNLNLYFLKRKENLHEDEQKCFMVNRCNVVA